MRLAYLVWVVAACQAEVTPPAPSAPAPSAPAPAVGPAKVAPACIDLYGNGELVLRAQDGDPVACGKDARCLRLGARGPQAVAMPPEPPPLPLSADVREVSGRWSVCRDATCVPVGRRLAAALARSAAGPQPIDADGRSVSPRRSSGTLDLRAVVVDDALWNVGDDRAVTLKRPTTKPWGPEKELTVAGDVVLVQWIGDCTDMLCMTSQAVDRRGLELGWVVRSSPRAANDLLRIDDDHFFAIAELDGVSMYELHTARPRGAFKPPINEHTVAVARLGGTRYGVLRTTDAGVAINAIDVAGGHLAVTGHDTTLPACEP